MNELMLQSGQRLMTGFSGTTPPKELVQTVKKYKIGNYILFAVNIASARQLRQLCAAGTGLIIYMIAALAHPQRFAGMCVQHQSTAGKRAKVNTDSETFQNFCRPFRSNH